VFGKPTDAYLSTVYNRGQYLLRIEAFAGQRPGYGYQLKIGPARRPGSCASGQILEERTWTRRLEAED